VLGHLDPCPSAGAPAATARYSLPVSTVLGLCELLLPSDATQLRLPASFAIDACMALAAYPHACVRARVLGVLDEAVALARPFYPRVVRASLEVITCLLAKAFRSACSLSTGASREPEPRPPQRAQPQQQQLLQQQRRAVAELCGTTLRECAPLLLRGMESLEDAPLEDAAAATRAAVAFLRLGHHVHVQEHPEAPSARSIAAGALGLFKLRRSHRHADLLRLQALLLPLLPSLLAARPIAELMPILRDATRTLPSTDRPTGEPLLLKGLRDAKAAQTLSVYLTATAVLRYQPATMRLMLCELMATLCVLKGMDTAIPRTVRSLSNTRGKRRIPAGTRHACGAFSG